MIEFTREAEAVIALARHEAGLEKIGPEHLLLAIVEHEHNLGAQAILHGASSSWGPAQCLATFRKKIAVVKETQQGTRRAAPPPEPDPPATGDFDLKELLPTVGRLGAVILEDLAKRIRRL